MLILFFFLIFSLSGCISSEDGKKISGDSQIGEPSSTSGSGSGSGTTTSSLIIVGGNLQTVTINTQASSSLVVMARDGSGLPIANSVVTFGLSGSGSISATSVLTNSSGLASVDYTAGASAGSPVVTAISPAGTATFNLSVVALGNYSIQLISGSGLSGSVGSDLGTPLRVQVLDPDGNAASGIPVTFSVQSGNGTIGGSVTIIISTNSLGFASSTYVLGTSSGVNTVRAALTNSPTVYTTFTNTGTVSSSSAIDYSLSTVTLSQSSSQANGSQLVTVSVQVRDIYGNLIPNPGHTVETFISPVAGYGSWNTSSTFVYSSTGTYSNVFKVGTSPGVVLFSGQINSSSILSGVPSLILSTGSTTSAGGASLVVVSGSSQQVGFGQVASSPLKIVALDSLGIPIQGSAITFTVTSGSGLVSGVNSVAVNTGSDGTAQVNFTGGSASGPVVVTASSLQGTVAFSLITQDLTGYTVTATGGDGQTGFLNATLSPYTVRVTKPNGQPEVGFVTRFQCQSANCGTFTNGLTSIDATTDSDGYASATYSFGTVPGNYTVRAILPAQSSIYADLTSTATVNPASTISLSQSTVTLSSSSAVASGSDTVVATVVLRDQYGNTIPNSSATIAVTPSTGSLGSWNGSGFITTTAGIYTRTYSLGTISGTMTFAATINGQSITSGTASLTIGANSPPDLTRTTITALNSSLTADGSSGTTIVVTLYDQYGNQNTNGGYSVVVTANTGTLSSSMAYHSATGTYRQSYVAPGSIGTGSAIITASTVNGTAIIGKSTTISLVAGTISFSTSSVSIPNRMVSTISTAQTVTVYIRDASNNLLTLSPAPTLTASVTAVAGSVRGTLSNSGTLTYVSPGTYTVTLTSPSSVTGCTTAPYCIDSINVNITHSTINSGTPTSVGTRKVQWGMSPTLSATNGGLLTMPVTTGAAGVGSSTLTAVLQLYNTSGQSIQVGGNSSSVNVATSFSTPTVSVVDNDNGTYTISIPSSASGSTGTLTVTTGASVPVTNGVQNITFYGTPSTAQSTISLSSSTLNGAGNVNIRLNLKDSNGINIPVLSLADSQVRFIENGNTTLVGTDPTGSIATGSAVYTQQISRAVSPTIGFEEVAISAQIFVGGSWQSLTSTQNLTITPPNLATVTINCTNITQYRNTALYVQGGTLTINSWINGAVDTSGDCATYGASAFTFASLTIGSTGRLVHSAATTTAGYGIDMVVSGVLSIDGGGEINVSGLGYLGGSGVDAYGYTVGPVNTAGVGSRIGGSYGLQTPSTTVNSSTRLSNSIYGSASDPNAPGSGGGTGQSAGGNCSGAVAGKGGGLARIQAASIINNGAIKADGNSPTATGNFCAAGGGSGGGIKLTLTGAGTLTGTGTISAKGGTGGYNGAPTLDTFNGSGGRIAIIGNATAYSYSNISSIGGNSASSFSGTLYFTQAPNMAINLPHDLTLSGANASVLPLTDNSVDVTVPTGVIFTLADSTTTTVKSFTVAGTLNAGTGTLSVANNMSVTGTLTGSSSAINIGGNFTTSGSVTLSSGPLVATGSFTQTAGTITHINATPTNYGSAPRVDITAANITVNSILASGKGLPFSGSYAYSYTSSTNFTLLPAFNSGSSTGPGYGAACIGPFAGISFGNANYPYTYGGSGYLVNGGGIVRLTSPGTIDITGNINVSGVNGNQTTGRGASGGGSIYINGSTVRSSNNLAQLNADGGGVASYTGGGGIIRIYRASTSGVINTSAISPVGSTCTSGNGIVTISTCDITNFNLGYCQY